VSDKLRPNAGASAVERGGDVRVGLEDRPWGIKDTNTRASSAVRLVRKAGGEARNGRRRARGVRRVRQCIESGAGLISGPDTDLIFNSADECPLSGDSGPPTDVPP
jgi:hypothetical protein